MVQEEQRDDDRDWTRIALIAGCVLAALTAALLVPSLASEGIAGSPIDSVLPGERFDDGEGQGAFGEGGSGFGALNPGDSTGVGGDTGFDKDTFGNNDTEVHFQVESSESAYWRTGTYGIYTGTGWERDVERTPYDGSVDVDGLEGTQIVYEVEFERPATALPTAWRPTSVSGLTDLEVTETGSFVSRTVLEPGTSFSAVSRQPVRDVDVLRAAGGEYPDQVENRYTQLPDDTPGRVGALTDEITADDETAYDAARSIQNWLRAEKDYSLQASRQSEHMADTFIFEMEDGYCEYFATAMTTMLRTQGIPARYTVGYTTGQEVGENRYEVRGMNAHAWVEVYFPEVGWVRFDPTPGGSRLEAQQEALQNEQPEVNYNVTEEGSPGEVFEPGEIREQDGEDPDPDDQDDETDDSGGYYDVSLNRTAVPGVAVEVTVTRDDSPVSEKAVLFNGEQVGVTDSEGTVVATVPDTDELRIEVTTPAASASVGGFSSPDTLAAPAAGSRPAGSLGITGEAGTADTARQGEDGNVTVVDVETEATVSVSGDALPGAEVTVVATVDDIAISDAAVFLDGERVGETDGSGRTTVTLPAAARNSTIVVERGPIYGETAVRIQSVELGVDTGLLALPLSGATVEVTADGEGMADAPVAVDGTEVARTGPDGRATVRLPLTASATISTTPGGLRREATVDGLLRNALLVLLSAGLVIGIPAGVAYSRGYRPRDAGSTLLGAVGWGRRALIAAVLGGRKAVGAALDRLSKTLVYLAEFAGGSESVASLQVAFGRWLRTRVAWLAGLVPSRASSDPADGGADADEPPVAVPTIREAWDRFLAVLDVPEPETKTPGELAAYAIEEAELPREPVETLRDAFRDVEYGDRSPGDSDETLLAAIEAIEDSAAELAAEEEKAGNEQDGTGRNVEGGDSSGSGADGSVVTDGRGVTGETDSVTTESPGDGPGAGSAIRGEQ